MAFWKSYQALSSKYKLAFGVGLLAWGAIGLRTTDKTEEVLGLVPSEQDVAALERLKPKLLPIERSELRSPSKDSK